MKKILVTGGTGFIGSALVKKLVNDGHQVRVLDNDFRGASTRIESALKEVEIINGDIRDPDLVSKALVGIDLVHHLAYINGTENFYTIPEQILEIAVKGTMNVIDGSIKAGVGEIYLASSSETYQTPPMIPTPEQVPLVVPDVMNPRYSYGGGKLISELLVINYGRKFFERVCIYRPHNVYGPDMGWEHVIPQFARRLSELGLGKTNSDLQLPIQGDGSETRSFCYIDDFIEGVLLLQDIGAHLNVYNIGTNEEIRIVELAKIMASFYSKEIKITPGELTKGSVLRRCPDISKIQSLGYVPKVSLKQGLLNTISWYKENIRLAP